MIILQLSKPVFGHPVELIIGSICNDGAKDKVLNLIEVLKALAIEIALDCPHGPSAIVRTLVRGRQEAQSQRRRDSRSTRLG